MNFSRVDFIRAIKSAYFRTALIMIFGAFSTFIAQLILTNTINIEIYGEFVTILTFAGIFSTFITLGLGVGQGRFIPRYLDIENNQLKGYGLASLSIYVTMLTLIALIIFIFSINNIKYFLLFFLVSTLSIFSFINNSLKASFQPQAANIFEPILKNTFFSVFIFLSFYFGMDLNLNYIVFIYAGILVVLSLMQFKMTWLKWFIKTGAPSFEVKKWVKISMPMSFASIAYLFAQSIDLVLISQLDSISNVAVYSIAIKMASILFLIFNAVKMVIAPYISKAYIKSELNDICFKIKKAINYLCVLSLLFLFMFIGFGEYILSFYGEDYIAAYDSMIILMVGYVFVISFGPSDTVLMMTNYERNVLVVYVCIAVINAFLNLLLIPIFSIVGAATATAITFVLQAFILNMVVRKELGVDFSIYRIRA